MPAMVRAASSSRRRRESGVLFAARDVEGCPVGGVHEDGGREVGELATQPKLVIRDRQADNQMGTRGNHGISLVLGFLSAEVPCSR